MVHEQGDMIGEPQFILSLFFTAKAIGRKKEYKKNFKK